MSEPTVLVGGNVQGDITSCKIENQVKSVKLDSIFSYQQQTTYISYDVCNKNIIAEYTKPEVYGGGVFLITLTAIIVIAFIIGVIRAFKWDGKTYIEPWNRF